MIYFDNNATTPLLAEVREAMLPFLNEEFGNPNSIHQPGSRARAAIEKARGQVARQLDTTPSEIVFTGCGSESNNQAIVGSLLPHRRQGKNLIISAIEHPSVENAARWMAETFGFQLRIAPFRTSDGTVDTQPFVDLMDEDTVFVSVILANNETGVIQAVGEIFAAAKSFGAVCHTDATQGFGKIRLDPSRLGCDLLSFSAHKFHGPKGSGALYLRRGLKIDALIHGGSQENGRRAGTENVMNIVGMGRAAEMAGACDPSRIAALRDRFEEGLLTEFGKGIHLNFRHLPRTPNTSSVTFIGQDGNLLLIKLDRAEICASTGAACSSGSLSASQTLLASGLTQQQAQATLRFSFSRLNTIEEVDRTVETLGSILKGKIKRSA